jgi:hypothetical protein
MERTWEAARCVVDFTGAVIELGSEIMKSGKKKRVAGDE